MAHQYCIIISALPLLRYADCEHFMFTLGPSALALEKCYFSIPILLFVYCLVVNSRKYRSHAACR